MSASSANSIRSQRTQGNTQGWVVVLRRKLRKLPVEPAGWTAVVLACGHDDNAQMLSYKSGPRVAKEISFTLSWLDQDGWGQKRENPDFHLL